MQTDGQKFIQTGRQLKHFCKQTDKQTNEQISMQIDGLPDQRVTIYVDRRTKFMQTEGQKIMRTYGQKQTDKYL